MLIIPLQFSPRSAKIGIILRQLGYKISNYPSESLNNIFLYVLEGREDLRLITKIFQRNCNCNLFLAFRGKEQGAFSLNDSVFEFISSIRKSLIKGSNMVIFYSDQENYKCETLIEKFLDGIKRALPNFNVKERKITKRLIEADAIDNTRIYLLPNGLDICDKEINHCIEENYLGTAINIGLLNKDYVKRECCNSNDKLKECYRELINNNENQDLIENSLITEAGPLQFLEIYKIVQKFCTKN